MVEAAEHGRDDWTHAFASAMRAEVDWAPIHFDAWGHYEQARPVLPDEIIEVIARWPDRGYTLQYRALLGELAQARQFPIDRVPQVTVLGRVQEKDLPELRSLAANGDVDALFERVSQVASTNRTIVTEPPVRTGSTIPAHAEIPVHYVPAEGRWLEEGSLIHENHPSAAYAVAGHWGLRLGAPVGLTPTGLLVFQPRGLEGARITIENPISQPIGPRLPESRVGVYRHDGLGGWHETATVRGPDELHLLMSSPTSAMTIEGPSPQLKAAHMSADS